MDDRTFELIVAAVDRFLWRLMMLELFLCTFAISFLTVSGIIAWLE